MPQFRKKPVVIEAMEYTGENSHDVMVWGGGSAIVAYSTTPPGCLVIPTLEGDHLASPGDYIIRGVQGELYPCKPDIFAQTYEPA